MLKISRTQPSTGQFIEMWEFGGQVWSENYKWINDTLHKLDRDDDCWIVQTNLLDGDRITNVQYISVK